LKPVEEEKYQGEKACDKRHIIIIIIIIIIKFFFLGMEVGL
jgi:flagellar basal body-associated protein FliL